MRRYAIVIEKAGMGTIRPMCRTCPAAWRPARRLEAIEAEIRDAIRFHIEGLQADGLEVPEPTSIAEIRRGVSANEALSGPIAAESDAI